MKIKQSVAIPKNAVTFIFGVSTLIALALRLYQVFGGLIDTETGFYVEKNFSVYALYGVIVIGCALMAILSFLSKDSSDMSIRQGSDIPVVVSSSVLSVVMIFDSLYALFGAALSPTESVANGFELFQSLMRNGTLPMLGESFFALLSALYFVVFASSHVKGTAGYEKRKILALAPVVWAAFRMIRLFVRQIKYTNVSDLLLELFLVACLLIFLLAFAQSASKVYDEGVGWRLTGFGYPCALLCIVTAVPRLLLVITGKPLVANHPLYPCDIALAALVISIALSKNNSSNTTLNGEQTDVS